MASEAGPASTTPSSWWDSWPALYEEEFAAFARYGVEPTILLKERGMLILEANWSLPDRAPVRVRIGFSPFHPFARPAVTAPDAEFGRHQDPLHKGLCLIPNEPGQWRSRQLVADFIDERLRHLTQTLEAREAGNWEIAAKLEEHVPDPLMPYYSSAAEVGSVALFDGRLGLPLTNCGIARLVVRSRPHPENADAIEIVLSQVEEVDARVRPPAFSLPAETTDGTNVIGRWVRMTPPPTDDPVALLAAAEEAIRAATTLEPRTRTVLDGIGKATSTITVMFFGDEHRYEDRGARRGLGCLFLVSRSRTKGTSRRRTSLVRGEAISDEMFARVPASRAVRDKRILLVGCGAIGSFVALELARLGVGSLTLWDHDIVRPGNSVRWPFGRAAWGLGKTLVLGSFILRNYPWTKISGIQGQVGGTTTDPESVMESDQNQFAIVRENIRNVDLVIDTTGSTEAQEILNHTAREMGVPYVIGYSTLGAAGGIVATFPQSATSCLVCLIEHWLQKSLPEPPVEEEAMLFSGGCNSATFTGSSFDLQEVSMQVMRRAVALLAGKHLSNDGSLLDVLQLRDTNGGAVPPEWTSQPIPAHELCCAA